MSPALSIATSLSPDIRQDIGIQVLARTEPISDLADKHQVSRKFVCQQGDKARRFSSERLRQRSMKPLSRRPQMTMFCFICR